MYFIGLDVHTTRTHGSVVREGVEVFKFKVATTAGALQEAISSIGGPKRVVVEEGTMADWCRRQLQGLVTRVVVSDPRRNRLISEAEDKDDPVDAFRLATLDWLGQIQEVYHGEERLQKLKEAVLAYWQGSRDLVRAKTRLKSHFVRRGLVVRGAALYRKATYELWRQRLQQQWGEVKRADQLFEQVQFYRGQKVASWKHLRQRQQDYQEQLEVLRTIPGFGPRVAPTFLAIIGDPWRFSGKRKLWKYCGLAVRQQKSRGKLRGRPRRSNQFNRLLKHVLGLAVRGALNRRQDNPIKARARQLQAQGKSYTIIRRELSRQLAQVAWTMMKTAESYRH